ncbi:MAG: family 16 glycoside hydrolase [Ktedonobacteraceae bacterium]
MKETAVSPCARLSTKLAARHARDLTADERIELNQHLATCAACASIHTAYAAMETRIRSLPTVAPLTSLPLTVVEGEAQTTPFGSISSTKSRTRENILQPVPRRQTARSQYKQLPRSLEMGLALAFVACIIVASLALFQRVHTSTGAMSPQAIYHQATSGPPTLSDPMTGPYVHTWWDQWASCFYAGGVYHVTAPQQNLGTVCDDQGRTFSNFAFQVKMTILKGDMGGVVFRSTHENLQTYKFLIGTDDTYFLNVSPYKGKCKLLASGYSAAIQNGLPQSNTLTVIARGSSIYLYINGQAVTQVKDSTATSGMIGLFADNVAQATDVVFRDVKVWQL